MDPALPVIEAVTFRANNKCLEDLGLFKEVRDIVAATTSVKAMYWGRSIEFPSFIIWLLLWDSFTESAAREGTPSHAEMVRKLDALVEDSTSSKRVLHVHFPEHPPLACIEAPVTEFDVTVLKDVQCLAAQERLVESIMSNLRAAQMEGHLSMARAKSLEDVRTAVYFSGWTSVEEHMKFGSVESHQVMVKQCEELFPYWRDMQAYHVHFERHA